MAGLDSIIEQSQDGLTGTDYKFIDADTLKDSQGNSFRIQGINAPEVEKIVDGKHQLGEAGGAATTETLRELANTQGFSNVRPVLDEDGEPRIDQYGRGLVELVNDKGETFQSKLLESGVLGPTRYTDAANTLTAELGQLRREQAQLRGESTNDVWDQARDQIETAMLEEGAKSLGFKRAALDEAQLAAARQHGMGHFYSSDNVQVRNYDRTIGNKSLNPFSDSWEQGWTGVKESSYGMLNLLGETTGSEWLADIGEAGVQRAQTEIRDYGTTLTDWREVRDADGIGGKFDAAIDYITNNAALSLPYMAISLGGAAAAPLTGGLSLAAPASVYAGQTWNEMEGDKNAAVAVGSGIAQAALDRLGLGFIAGKVGAQSGSKLIKEATQELIRQGKSPAVAAQMVSSATRKEMAGFVGDVATVARQQITAKNTFKNLAIGTGVGAGGEAVTEALQESVGYLGATMGSDKVFDFQELTDRALAGAIAGATLGGAFSVPGSLYDAGAWADVAVRQAPADVAKASRDTHYENEAIQQEGRVTSNLENAADAAARAANNTELVSLEERAQLHQTRKKGRQVSEQIFDAVASAPSLWQGATRFIFRPELTDKSISLRKLKDMFGGGLQKTYSGPTMENQKHHIVSIYKNMVAAPEKVFASFNNGNRTGRKQREQISDQIYNDINAATVDGKFNPDLVPEGPHKQATITLQQELQRLSDKMYADQKKYNPDLGYQTNYLTTYKAFDKNRIRKQKVQFTQALMDTFPGMTKAEADSIADAITNNDNVNDFGEALDATKAAGKPGSHKGRTLELAQRPEFQQFMERDIFRNVNAAAKSAARYTAYQQFLGNDNKIVAQLLQDAQNEGIDPAEINKIASQLGDYFLAESGNYKRAKSDFGKNMEKIQRNFMMVSTIAGLPLATISSFVEAALTMRGLTMDQIMGTKDKPGGLFHLGNELGATLWSGMDNIFAFRDKKQREPAVTKGKEVLKNLGFYEWDVGAATTTGVSETNPHQQYIYENFFKWTGLQGWTNYTRAVRGAIAGDYIMDKLNILLAADPDNYTNEDQEAREGLRNIGVNVDQMLEAYRGGGQFDPNSASIIEENFREGMFNFVNDAVALPQSGNRPLIYQDPRFALFTQFQGFIATFTANHIPKLWGEYVQRGTPAMKYNAFAVMTTMIMLGFASQYLKDLIKHFKTPAEMGFGPEDHPFLNPAEYLQRGIRASGLLGTGERVLDQFFPIYDQQSDNPGEWAFNTVAGEAPTLGFAQKAGKATGALLEGDVGKAAKEGSRFLPLFGVLNFSRDAIGDAASNWNFR